MGALRIWIWLAVLGLPLRADPPVRPPRPMPVLPLAKPVPPKPPAPKRRDRMKQRDRQIDRMLKSKQKRDR
jgi:hypothetical protein